MGSGVSIYPNPLSGDVLTIDLKGLSGTTKIKILNVNGQELKSIVVIDQQVASISKAGLVSGIYFIQIDNPQQKVVKTLVVK